MNDVLVFFRADSPPRSPDSVLKLKLCPPLSFFPASSSSQSYRSTFDRGSRGEYHDQRRQLLSNSSPPPHYTLFETHLGSQVSSPVALESISRGPDGRFLVQLLEESCSSSKRKSLKEGIEQVPAGASGSGSNRTSFRESPNSGVFSLENDESKGSPLTLDVAGLPRPPSSPGRVRAMATNFSRHGCFHSDHELGSEALLERASFYSDISEKKPSDAFRRSCVPGHMYRKPKPLDRNGPSDSQPANNSTEISQLSSEPEGEHGRGPTEPTSNETEAPQREDLRSKEEAVWKPQNVTMRQKHAPAGQTSCVADYRRACYFGSTSSPMDRLPRSRIQWDISPIASVSGSGPAAQSHQGTTSPGSQRSLTCLEPTEDSFTGEASRSPLTQNTVLTPDVTSESPTPVLEEPTSATASLGLQPDAEPVLSGAAVVPSSGHSHSGSHLWARRSPAVDGGGPGNSAASYIQPDRTAGAEYAPTPDPGPAGFSTLPYDHREVGARAKEVERESERTPSRRSEKFLFAGGPSPISTLTLVEDVDPDLSQYSVPRMSGSFRAKPPGPSPKLSPQQTSAVLEYLSLPGFIEMSVDEPQGAEITGSSGKSSRAKSEKSPRTNPDVVPKNWEVHVEENQEIGSEQPTLFGRAAEASKPAYKRSFQGKSRDSAVRVRFPDEMSPSPPSLGKTSKQLYQERTQTAGPRKSTDRAEFRLGSRSAHTLLSAAKGVAGVVSKHSQSCSDGREALLEPTRGQGQLSQGSRVNNIASRICQAPVPFLKKSFSAGPCRALSGMAPPRPFLKKSFSLGSQRWEHFESPRMYISEKSYWDEFPSPDLGSYSLSRSQSSSPRPDPPWREYIPFRPPGTGTLERPGHAHRSFPSCSYLTSSPFTPRQTSVSPLPEPADPRRQAAVFLECPRWSPSYQDMFRSARHKYVPVPSSIPVPQQQPHWPGPRAEPLRSANPRRGPPRSYLPRGVSCPSGYYVPAPPREGDIYPRPDRTTRREGDPEGGRTSYASQSSGRGSASFLRQSLSVTPTLLSSPETTEDSERLRAETERLGRRSKR